MAGILFEDIFDVKDIDPDGMKFERGKGRGCLRECGLAWKDHLSVAEWFGNVTAQRGKVLSMSGIPSRALQMKPSREISPTSSPDTQSVSLKTGPPDQMGPVKADHWYQFDC
ncbi:UNVERIFIED_CONTAM: hypothetical protein FKN15_033066 [Acipenser sinensis]